MNPTPAKGGVEAVVIGLIVVAVLLILPIMALHRRGVDLRWVGAYGLVLSAVSYWTYAIDKKRAQDGEWRVSEAQLHLWELLGGWPGAWIAQRRLRHKNSKRSYRFVFWLIVLSYQLAAVDSIQDRKLSRAGLKWMEETSGRRK